jgi:hypothetical protein
MSQLTLPARDERGVIVFKVWPSLAYETRMGVAFALIAAGLLMQFLSGTFFIGGIVLAAGNLLLLVRGYDNRVDFGRFDPGADWERAEPAKLDELQRLDRKIRAWDVSLLDATNAGGAVILVVLGGFLGLVAWTARGMVQILALDGLVLLLPHWITGVRSILVLPNLMIKVRTLQTALRSMKNALEEHEVNLMILLRGGDAKVPEDLKIKVDIKGQHADFLGLYGQVVINEVKGSSYPYFYTVLVAREGYGMRDAYERYQPPSRITTEFKRQDKVEVLVIRQTTTKTSGYHTERDAVARILLEGLRLAEQVAAPAKAS